MIYFAIDNKARWRIDICDYHEYYASFTEYIAIDSLRSIT